MLPPLFWLSRTLELRTGLNPRALRQGDATVAEGVSQSSAETVGGVGEGGPVVVVQLLRCCGGLRGGCRVHGVREGVVLSGGVHVRLFLSGS